MGKILELISRNGLIYVLAAIAFSVIVSELRKKRKTKIKFTNLIGECFYSIILNFSLLIMIYPFVEGDEKMESVLLGITLILSVIGNRKAEKLIRRIFSYFLNDNTKDGAAMILEGILMIINKHNDSS